MKTKLLYSLILSFILCSFSVTSASQLLFSEQFAYNDAFSNHGWSMAGFCGTDPQVPIDSPFGDYAFGVSTNNSYACTGYTRYISRTLPANISNGILVLTYSYAIYNDTTKAGATGIQFRPSDGVLPYIDFKHNNKGDGYNASINGVNLCNLLISYPPVYGDQDFRIVLDFNNQVFSWYKDYNSIDCVNIPLTLNYTSFIRIYESLDAFENISVFIDDLYFYTDNASLNVFGVGVPCTSNDECLTGKCENGFCVQKLKGEECVNDYECLSGNCINGRCTKPSGIQLLDQSKTELFGDDPDTNNFISLIFMIAIPSGVIIMAGGSAIGIIFGFFLFIILGFFFAIIGWLSAWIILGIILSALIGVVALLMFKSNG